MLKNFITDYLSFTRKERSGTLVVLLLIVIFITIPFLYPFFIHSKVEKDTAFKTQMEKLVIRQQDTTKKFSYKNYERGNYENSNADYAGNYNSKKTEGELFTFDPNTLDKAGWERLGLKEKTIATIQKFVSKKGKFYKPEDIRKIWGLHEDEIKRLIPYIIIESKKTNYPENKAYENKVYDKPKYMPALVDINTADTAMLIALPGIGSKLSQRIIVFRERLGGFYKIEQVGETFGLKDSVFQLLKPRFTLSATPIKQLNINTATVDELKVHPYIRFFIANAIIQYRNQHGKFISIGDIKKIMLVTEDIFNKVAPYLKVN